MLQRYEDKRPKEQGNLFHCDCQQKTDHSQEREGNTTEIRNPKTKCIFFFFDYYNRINGTKDTKKLDTNPEINYCGIYGYKYQTITLNNHLFLNYFQIENIHSLLSYPGCTHIYSDSSQEKYNHFIFYIFSSINKLEENINLKIYKETNLVSPFRTLFYKIVLEKDILYLLFSINIILMIFKVIYDYAKREEKIREIYNPVEAPKIIMDLNKNGFCKIQNETEKIINLKGRTKK